MKGIRFFDEITSLLIYLTIYHGIQIEAVGDVVRSTSGFGLSSPAIGRGYSHISGAFLSDCIDEPTEYRDEATFDYDYKMQSFTSRSSRAEEIKNGFSGFVLTGYFNGAMAEADRTADSKNTNNQHIITIMSIDKYFHTVDETNLELNERADNLLILGDILGFIMACGPRYVRSMRRRSEVSGFFTWYSDEETDAESVFSQKVGIGLFPLFGIPLPPTEVDLRHSEASTTWAYNDNMTIKMNAVGIDLTNVVSSSSLVATDVESYKKAIDFFFLKMISPNVGVIFSIEVVPWVHHPTFQTHSQVDSIDFGAGDVKVSVLQKKFNYMANAEHISNMDHVMRQSSRFLYNLHTCVGFLSSLTAEQMCKNWIESNIKPLPYGDKVFTNHNYNITTPGTGYENTEARFIQAGRLKYLLDGYGDSTTAPTTTVLETIYQQHHRYVTRFFMPCFKKLSDLDPNKSRTFYIFTEHWSSLPECNDVTCMMPNAYYANDVDANCILRPSLIQAYLVNEFCQPRLEVKANHTCP